MTLSREERNARREHDRAVLEQARQADRAEKIVDEVFAAHVAKCVYDGLTERRYIIAYFAIPYADDGPF